MTRDHMIGVRALIAAISRPRCRGAMASSCSKRRGRAGRSAWSPAYLDTTGNSWEHFRPHLIAAIAESSDETPYYESWVHALEDMLAADGVSSSRDPAEGRRPARGDPRGHVRRGPRAGFAQTRMSDVAHRLGISPPLVVYHFGSKDALLAEAFAYASRNEMVDLDAIADATDDALDRLDALLVCWPRSEHARVVGAVDRLVGRGAALACPAQDLAAARRPLARGARGSRRSGDESRRVRHRRRGRDGSGARGNDRRVRRAGGAELESPRVSLDQARRVALALLGVSAAQPRP